MISRTILLILFTLTFSSSLLANKKYYGNAFPTFDKISSVELKNILNIVVSNPHIPQQNSPDIILKQAHCPAEVSSCYRHHLLDEGNSYKASRMALYGIISPMKLNNGKFRISALYSSEPLIFKASTTRRDFPRKLQGTGHNCEHTWPRSRFGNSKNSGTYRYQKSDIHHLYPSKSKLNSMRSNFLFAETINQGNPKTDNMVGSAKHPMARRGQNYFYPIENSRGRVARAMFYFSIRYKLPISKVDEFFLRKWHNEFPVTQEEIIRNNRIHKVQGNRNPFVDYPKLESFIENF